MASQKQNETTMWAAMSAKPVTKADSDLPFGACKAILCGTSGTVNLKMLDGDIITNFPLQQGYNPIMVSQIRTSGTATDLWALY